MPVCFGKTDIQGCRNVSQTDLTALTGEAITAPGTFWFSCQQLLLTQSGQYPANPGGMGADILGQLPAGADGAVMVEIDHGMDSNAVITVHVSHPRPI